MEIKDETTVYLTPKDVEEMIIHHLKKLNIDVKTVIFDINGHNRDDDVFAQFPLDYTLDKIICKGTKII